jgi:hypothetical protein
MFKIIWVGKVRFPSIQQNRRIYTYLHSFLHKRTNFECNPRSNTLFFKDLFNTLEIYFLRFRIIEQIINFFDIYSSFEILYFELTNYFLEENKIYNKKQ